jgi:hypothetical protein
MRTELHATLGRLAPAEAEVLLATVFQDGCLYGAAVGVAVMTVPLFMLATGAWSFAACLLTSVIVAGLLLYGMGRRLERCLNALSSDGVAARWMFDPDLNEEER